MICYYFIQCGEQRAFCRASIVVNQTQIIPTRVEPGVPNWNQKSYFPKQRKMHFSPKWFRDRKIAMKLQIETDTHLVQDPLTDNSNSTQEKEEIFVSSVVMPGVSSSSASSSTGLV